MPAHRFSAFDNRLIGALPKEARDSSTWAVWKVLTRHEDVPEPSLVLLRVRNSGEGKLRAPPGELSITEASVQGDPVPGVLGYVQAVVNRIGGSGRNQVHVDDRARGPGISLVDGIAVIVDLQRAVEMGAFFDWALAAVLDHAAPEDDLSFVIRGF